jgi:hypothetical protein
MGNVALLVGETRIAASVGSRLLKEHRSMGGLVLWLYSSFLSLSIAARAAIGLVVAGFLFLSSLRPAYLAIVAGLAIGALVARRARLVTTWLSLIWSCIVLAIAYLLVLLADTGKVVLALGILGAAVALVVGVIVLRRFGGRRNSAH